MLFTILFNINIGRIARSTNIHIALSHVTVSHVTLSHVALSLYKKHFLSLYLQYLQNSAISRNL